MGALRSIINGVLSAVCCFLFAAMVVIGTYQIVTRYVFNSPSTISEELLTYSFTWMALLISAYIFGKRDHMRVNYLADKVKGSARVALEVLIEAMTVAVSAIVFVYGGLTMVDLTMMQKTASLGIPMGTVYAVVPISGVLIVIYGLMNIAELLSGKIRADGSKNED